MDWFYTAFSSSSSSSPSSSYHRRQGSGSTNHRQITDNDAVHVPSRSISTPHILPLPELSALLKRDSRRESAADEKLKHILPSPVERSKKSDERRGLSDVSCLGTINRPRITDHKESQFLNKWTQGYNHGETVSAPTTPISSQAVFLTTSKVDMKPGGAYHCHTIPQRSMHDFGGSSVHSPDNRTRVKSPMPSSSPLHKRVSFESPTVRPESNVVATVHPLPLPPAAAGIPPSSPPQTCNRSDLMVDISRQSLWKKGKLIGRGAFGSVYVGSNRETGALCAMKEVEILPDDPKSEECIKQLKQEIDVLSQLKHPNIVQYYGSEIVEGRLYIYLEYVHPGSINKYARDHCGGMTESIVRNFTRHIVSGLAFLHSTKTIHRDIKGANLLVDATGVVKLADFGMAKHLDEQVNLSLKGSPYWMAPELLQGKPQKDNSPDLALAVDIWSLGCTIIEMMNGKPPWSEHEGPAAMFKVMKETPPIPEKMSPDGKDFLRCCFIRNPAERPTAVMLLEHKYLMAQNRRARSR